MAQGNTTVDHAINAKEEGSKTIGANCFNALADCLTSAACSYYQAGCMPTNRLPWRISASHKILGQQHLLGPSTLLVNPQKHHRLPLKDRLQQMHHRLHPKKCFTSFSWESRQHGGILGSSTVLRRSTEVDGVTGQ
eukprot:scaffold295169_cov18-Tisochrysis_lutea.AAC.2